jgi:hypothetical protein
MHASEIGKCVVKHLLKNKSRLTDGESIEILNRKIGNLISKNRSWRSVGNTGSRKWWDGVDKLSNRKYHPRHGCSTACIISSF